MASDLHHDDQQRRPLQAAGRAADRWRRCTGRAPSASGRLADQRARRSLGPLVRASDVGRSMSAIDVGRATLNGTSTMPRGTALVGGEREARRCPWRRRGAPGAERRADLVGVGRVDVGRDGRRQRGERRRVDGADGAVVQLAAHHQSIVVAVAVGGGETAERLDGRRRRRAPRRAHRRRCRAGRPRSRRRTRPRRRRWRR